LSAVAALLTINALTAAHGVLIPVQCEYFALEGLSSLLDTIKAVRTRLNPQLEIEGLLRTMYDVRNNLGNECRRNWSSTSATKCCARSSRATCAWPKRRATDCRSTVRPRIARRDRLSRPRRRNAAARTLAESAGPGSRELGD
jgi:cellulose biosynthesis protein BcsQ